MEQQPKVFNPSRYDEICLRVLERFSADEFGFINLDYFKEKLRLRDAKRMVLTAAKKEGLIPVAQAFNDDYYEIVVYKPHVPEKNIG
jgi:hypothetical protein